MTAGERDPGEPAAADPPTGWRGVWNDRRVRLWGTALLIAAWLPALGVPFRGWLDYSAFHVAASFAFTPDVSSLEAVVRAQDAAGLPIAPFLYPPGYVLPYVPLTWLPYPVAGAIHALVMLGLLIAAARIGARVLGLPVRLAIVGAIAWGPAAASVLGGQNVTLALLLLVLVADGLVRGLTARTGILAGLLAYKPQFAAPLVGMLLVRGRWRALAVALGALGIHYLAGVLATGGDAWWPKTWLQTLGTYSDTDLAVNGWQAVSLPAMLARVELPVLPGWLDLPGMQGSATIGYAAGLLIVLACLPALRRWDAPRALALAAPAGLLVMPHAWVHNAALLLPAVGVLAADAARRGWPWRDRWLMAILYLAGLTWPVGGVIGFTLLLPVVLAMPVLLAWSRRTLPADAPTADSMAVAARPPQAPEASPAASGPAAGAPAGASSATLVR